MNKQLQRWVVITTIAAVVVAVVVVYGALWTSRFHPTGQLAGNAGAKQAALTDRPTTHFGVHSGGYPRLLHRYEAQRFDSAMHQHRLVSIFSKWEKNRNWWESSQAAQVTPSNKG